MSRAFELLMIDAEPGQMELVRNQLGQIGHIGLTYNLHCVCQYSEAMKFLQHKSPFEGSARPSLILLNLQLPENRGGDLLRFIKSNADLRSIPVIVVSCADTLSDLPHDGLDAIAHTNRTGVGWLALLREIDRFWADAAHTC